MDTHGSIEQVRRVLLGAGELEHEDPEFRSVLADLASTGLLWGGGLGLLGILILVPVNVGLLGRPTAWWYPVTGAAEPLVLWDKGVVALLCGGAIWVGRMRARLPTARAVGGAMALLIAAVSLVHDAYRGVLSVEYVILIYLLAVVVVPYRPWQALLLGGALSTMLFGLGRIDLPGLAGPRSALVVPGHLVRMGFVTVVLTGVSALLYAVRHRRYQARRTAETLHEQVARLERAKSRFFADLSHEFRTPLTLILGPLDNALTEDRGGPIPDALRTRLERARHQARRMKRLVDQLYDLARLDEGDLRLTMQRHDVGALIREVVPPLRQWARAKNLAFQEEGDPEGLDAWVDADRIQHAVTTLLTNAIRYTPDGGTVRLRVARTDDAVEISVRDTGPGLPDALRERVFGDAESYVPVGETAADEGSMSLDAEQRIGLGIGLAHANALVQRHGGRIDVESEPGFGTDLTVVLPLGREHVPDEPAGAPDDAASSAGGEPATGPVPSAPDEPEPTTDAPADAPTVLVVDGDAEMRAYLRDLLGPDYRVETAADRERALGRLRDRSFDLVLSDTSLPDGDGAALCRAIREEEALRHLPVLLLTNRPDGAEGRSDRAAGADAYVSKPFDPGELTARVENLIEIRRIVQDRVRLPDWMEPTEATVSSEDAEFVEALNEAVDAHIDNSNFGVDWLADEMDLSARHLRRRIKETTGLSASGFIRTRRLQHAAALLRQGADTISDVASTVGYRDPSYFSRLFRETFGCSPTEYAEQDHEAADNPDTSP